MFEGVEAAANDEGAGKGRFAASTGISIGICVVLGVVLATVGAGVASSDDTDQQDIQVTFQEPAAPEPKIDEPPPPPPAPKQELKRRTSTVAKTPTILPGEQLAEGSENDFRGSGSDAIEDITAPVMPEEVVKTMTPPPAPPPPIKEEGPGGRELEPVYVPDDGVPPRALAGNASPAYPEDARKKSIEGTVVLRFIVTREGRVANIQVVKGAEPFVSAAIAVVKTWRYSPAKVDGRIEDAWHRVELPFQLKT